MKTVATLTPGMSYLRNSSRKSRGQRFRRFVDREIFLPQGINHYLVYEETRPKVENRTTSYSWKKGLYQDVDYTPLNFIYGEDGIYTILDDILRSVNPRARGAPRRNAEKSSRRVNTGVAARISSGVEGMKEMIVF